MMTQLTIKCVIREISTFYFARICAHAREVGVSSRNLVSRTFPQFYQSMLTAMICLKKIQRLATKLIPELRDLT